MVFPYLNDCYHNNKELCKNDGKHDSDIELSWFIPHQIDSNEYQAQI